MKAFKPIGDRVLIRPVPREEKRGGYYLIEEEKAQEPRGEVIAVGPGQHNDNRVLRLILKFMVWCYSVKRQVKLAIPEKIRPVTWDEPEVPAEFSVATSMVVKPGDRVMYGQYAGTKVKIRVGEDLVEHLIIREADIFGILEPEDPNLDGAPV